MNSWYEKCMPKIKDVKPHISGALGNFKNIKGVKDLYIWGSYAENIDNPNFRIRDIDVLVKTQFNSGDLIAINDSIVKDSYSDEHLENQGYDPLAIKFSKKFLELSKYNVDCWAVSSDRKLLHWGPSPCNKNDSDNINQEAENYATHLTGISRKKINKSSEKNRKNWFNSYKQYINQYFNDMPTGWYKMEEVKIKDLFAKAIKCN